MDMVYAMSSTCTNHWNNYAVSQILMSIVYEAAYGGWLALITALNHVSADVCALSLCVFVCTSVCVHTHASVCACERACSGYRLGMGTN